VQTRYALYVVEIRLSVNPLPAAVVKEVQAKERALGTFRNLSVRAILVHVNGAAAGVMDADYFDKIIDFGSLLTQ